MTRVITAIALATAIVVSIDAATTTPAPVGSQGYSTELASAFDLAYNLDFTEALAAARGVIATHPDEPAAYRAVATVTWLQILFARGGTFVDHYLGKVTKMQVTMPQPPADLDAEFNKMIDKAIAIGDAHVRAHPKDAQAQFDLGSAWALRAGYAGSVQGSVTGAFAAARKAFNAQEYALKHDPKKIEPNLVVGMYRYAVSTLGMPSRMLAYMAGFGGGKERGIQMVERAATGGTEQADALFALAVIYSRDGRHADAVTKLQELVQRFPRNRILVLEEGAALIRAGHPDTADAVITAGMAKFNKDPRQHTLGEHAYWYYKRGLARLNWNHRADAATDLEEALAANPVGWVRGRIHVARGQLMDLAGKRTEAIADYRLGADYCGKHNDPFCVAEAVQFSRKPFALQ